MSKPVLTTKLHVPSVRSELVRRPRLLERLDRGVDGKLTLVSAPAGYGKTTLLTDWIDRTQMATAWLSLDEADNDVVRFLTYLIAALQQIDRDIGVDIQAALTGAQAPPTDTLLTRLVSEIALAAETRTYGEKKNRKLVLVFDDIHLIRAQPVQNLLGFLIDNLPRTVHLVMAGRADPPLHISRLRVQGEVTEIRTPELRFSERETAVFFNELMGLDLSAEDIAALEARTEGWIASLQLAALSMRGRHDKHAFVAAFSGSHRYVIDYLVDEVLSRQTEDIQAFLRQTSVLDQFCASLCDAALGIATGLQILRWLETDNLFLVPLDDERRWYRYHHLFADFLGQRLLENEPERIPELQIRASKWYEAEGMVDEAIRYALTAGHSERATRLVDQVAPSLIVRSESKRLLDWINQLPPHLLQGYPRLCIYHAWALILGLNLDGAEAVLRIAEANQSKASHLPIDGYVTTVRAFIANQMWELSEAISLCQLALEQMADASPEEDTLIHRGIAVIWLAANYRYTGDLDRARQILPEAVSLNQQAGSVYAALAAMEQLGELAVTAGQLGQVVEIYRRGLQMAQNWSDQEGRGRVSFPAVAGLHLRLGTVLYQLNDLAGAAPNLQRAVELSELGETWERMPNYKMLAYLKQAVGDYEAAYELLGKACATRDNLVARQIIVMAEPSVEQLRILLSRVRPDMAPLLSDVARWIESRGLRPDAEVDLTRPADHVRESEFTDLARGLIALGQSGEAMPLLERLLDGAQTMGRQDAAVRYLVLLALAFRAQGDTPSALETLSQALMLAESEGYVRLFVDEGEPMAELLREVASRGDDLDYVNLLLAAFGERTRDGGPPSMVEPLSERELEVLGLLGTGLTYRQVAEQLIISLNTVRHHTRNIYGKLGVRSRTQAIARTQELGLL